MKKSIYNIGGKLLNKKEQKSIHGGIGVVVIGGCAKIREQYDCFVEEVCEWRNGKCDTKQGLPPHIVVAL